MGIIVKNRITGAESIFKQKDWENLVQNPQWYNTFDVVGDTIDEVDTPKLKDVEVPKEVLTLNETKKDKNKK